MKEKWRTLKVENKRLTKKAKLMICYLNLLVIIRLIFIFGTIFQ